MPQLPAEGTMKAAVRWLRALRTADIDRARALFIHHDAYADLTPDQYSSGLEWLRRIGMVPVPRAAQASPALEERFLNLQLLEKSLEAARPDWITGGNEAAFDGTWLPAPGRAVAGVLGLSNTDAAAAVEKAWLAERARVGAAGEQALVTLIARSVHAEVVHVSAFSDRFGYDIAVESARSGVHLEVKTTTHTTGQTIFLSRHEYETMRTDPAWHLVFLLLDEQDQLTTVSTVSREWIARAVPRDQHSHGAKWASARLPLPSAALTPGIEALHEYLSPGAPATLLTGSGRPHAVHA
ncbi:DUF3883 domain-containing protein [Kitasatospora sp. RG8]|uniref:protein NO VEIN domain-containing protein n=1 Tax=Kitasatospora sp. RG8 TaxID=2820815 RepID=UPI001ADEF5D1|nr:DUF3883 domain-containing protein [Kitasatospora sp. RG8]MBP0451932.1 DUF3883 domain-containing protein [Kitasatospora sp. RG8]